MKGNCYGDFQPSIKIGSGDFKYKDNDQMGFSVSDLWDQGVTAVEHLASAQIIKLVSPPKPATVVPASAVITQPATPQGQSTTNTQYVNQPITEFQSKALLYGGIAVGGIVLLGLVKTMFPPTPRY
jgi:hypothetical protein